MLNAPAWEIGRALGIPIRVHPSWVLVFLFVTWSLATGYLPEALPGLSNSRYWGMGAVAAVLLFVSVLLHEHVVLLHEGASVVVAGGTDLNAV